MSAFDSFQRASFAGIEFPWEERTVQGSIREHEHKYPHSPGAALETLGRELYVIHFKCTFQDTFKSYPDLYPGLLGKLRNLYEIETRDDLVIPGIGTIKAVISSINQRANPKESRSGEKVELSFREDIEDAFLVNNLIGVTSKSLLSAAKDFEFNIAEAKRAFMAPRDQLLFDSIISSINSVLGIVDTIDAYGNLVEAKILSAASLLYQADRRIRYLNDPVNIKVMFALLRVWDALLTLFKDIQRVGGGVQSIIIKKTMSVIEISKSIYNGDGTKAAQILQMNTLDDIYAVPPGTTIRYYPKV